MPPEDRRRAIVQAVIPLLAEHGSDVSTRQIAEAAGVAEGTIFRVFPDKAALFKAAAEEAINPADADRSGSSCDSRRRRPAGQGADRGRAGDRADAPGDAGDVRVRGHFIAHAKRGARAGAPTRRSRPARVPGRRPARAAAPPADLAVRAARRPARRPPETAALALRSLIFGSARAELRHRTRAHPRPDRRPAARRHSPEGTGLMLLRLIRTYLAPYRRWLTVVACLQFAATVAMLFLPSLNADIIDNGVARGDTGYIVRIGGVMLAGLARPDRLLDRGRLVRLAYGDGRRPRPARRPLPPGRVVLRARDGAVRCPVADHPRHQRRAAGADARADDLHDGRDGPDHDGRRHPDGDARGPRALVAAGRRRARRCSSRSASSSPGWSRTSASCRNGSTRSTGCCASRSPASGWCARSSASRSRPTGSGTPTTSSPTCPSRPAAGWRRCSRS